MAEMKKMMAKPLLMESEMIERTLSFEVLGMRCQSCVKKVEKAIKDLNLSNLTSLKVELQGFNLGHLDVSLVDVSDDKLEELAGLIKSTVTALDLEITRREGSETRKTADGSAGQVAMPEASEIWELEVLGMKCGSCVSKAEKAIRALAWPTVHQVNVNLLSESARLQVKRLAPEELERATSVFETAFGSVGLEATVTQRQGSNHAASEMKSSRFEFEVLGMKCGSCVKKAEEAVKGLAWPKIVEVNVNLLSESATVHMVDVADGADGNVAAEAVITALAAVGLTASVTARPGQGVQASMVQLEGALRSIDGVADVQVNLLAETATVRLAEASADLEAMAEALQAAVEAAGYQANLKPASSAAVQEHEVVLTGKPVVLENDVESNVRMGTEDLALEELRKVQGVQSAVARRGIPALEVQVCVQGQRERVVRELLWALQDAGFTETQVLSDEGRKQSPLERAQERRGQEALAWKRKFLMSLVLTLPVVLLMWVFSPMKSLHHIFMRHDIDFAGKRISCGALWGRARDCHHSGVCLCQHCERATSCGSATFSQGSMEGP